MKRCKVCLVSTVQTSFWGSGERQFEKYYVPEMEKLARQLNFDLVCFDRILANERDSMVAKGELAAGNYDLLLVQVSTFSDGGIILPLAETGARIGLWAIPEITHKGAIPNNSFCGINMYGSIIHQYVDEKRPYKWFYGDVTDSWFIDRFQVTIRALTAITTLQGAKVALIGGIAPGFNDLYFDERQTKQRLGVSVNRMHEFSDIKDRALGYTEAEIASVLQEIKGENTAIADDMTNYGLENTARVYKAFEDVVKENGYDAIAISCWPRFRKELGIVVCSVIGRLLENGIVAACEGDLDSAISMLALRCLADEQPMLMDLSKFDREDNTVLMWHCGSAPKRYADKQGTLLDGHYKPGSHVTCQDNIRVSGVNNMYYGSRPITIARFTNSYRNMLTLSGAFVNKADRSYDGSRGWVGSMTCDGQPVAVEDLINTIMVQGFQHHFPIVAGNVEAEVREMMAWLAVEPLPMVKYSHTLQLPR